MRSYNIGPAILKLTEDEIQWLVAGTRLGDHADTYVSHKAQAIFIPRRLVASELAHPWATRYAEEIADSIAKKLGYNRKERRWLKRGR